MPAKKPGYQPETLEERYVRQRQEAVESCRDAWKKAKKLHWAAGGREKPTNRMRSDGSMNRVSLSEVGVVVSTISGRQIMRRFQREYVPRTQAHEVWAEALTKADKALSDSADSDIYESQAFRDGPVIGGVSWVRREIDNLEDERGRLVVKDVPIWNMVWDPAARDVNLHDRRWHSWGSWWAIEEVERRFPDMVSEVRKYVANRGNSWSKEAEKTTVSVRIPWEMLNPDQPINTERWDPSQRACWIERYEYWEVDTITSTLVPTDPSLTAEQIRAQAGPNQEMFTPTEMDPPEVSAFKADRLARLGEEAPPEWFLRKSKKTWKYAYFIDDLLLEQGEIPTGYWTMLAMTGDRLSQPERADWQPLMERIVDAQSFINLMLTALLRDIEINPKGVLLAEEGLFRNRDEAMRMWTAPGGLILVPRGKLAGGATPYRYEAGGTGGYSSKVSQLLDFWREAVPRLAGFNPAALGQLGPDLRRISGEVVRQVQDTAMVSNAGLFQSLSFYRRDSAKVVLGFMRELYGQDPSGLQALIDLVGEEVAYREIFDPQTGDPVIDPQTGEPMRELAIPPVEMWKTNAWREVAVEETEPTEEWRRELWQSLTESGGLATISQPWPDETLLQGQDVLDIMPSLTPRMRERFKAQWKRVQAKRRLATQFGIDQTQVEEKSLQLQSMQIDQQMAMMQQGQMMPPQGGGQQPAA